MRHQMHYDWVAAVFSEATPLLPADIRLVALYSELVDMCRPGVVKAVIPLGGPCPVITQSYEYGWFRSREYWDVYSYIWTRFHFGGPDAHREGRPCQAGDGRNYLVAIWEEVKNTKIPPLCMLARLGIALHVFMDSYSHQGFCGWRDSRNSRRSFFEWLTPDIGHADYGIKPDELAAVWERNGKKIVNRERFMKMGFDLWSLLTGEEPDTEFPIEPGQWAFKRKDGSLYQPKSLQILEKAKNDDALAVKAQMLWLARTKTTLPKCRMPRADVLAGFYLAAAEW